MLTNSVLKLTVSGKNDTLGAFLRIC